MNEAPDIIHGRMKEGAHIAGYSLSRSIENLRWLLEASRFEELSAGYRDVNDFLRDTQRAFALLNIKPEERKQIAELVKDLQPKASQRAIADMVGASEATVARDLGKNRYASNDAPTDSEPEKEVNLSASNDAPPPAIPPDDYDPVEKEKNKPGGLFSSDTDQWYTPSEIIDLVQQVLGSIDLDPCSNSKDAPNVPASNHFTIEDDGLLQEWRGRIYMNPPYGRDIILWVKRLQGEFELGNVTEAIALVPSRTDTEWFRIFKEYPRCFVWGRLKFSSSNMGAPFPSMAVYLGQNTSRFVDAFKNIGDIYALIK